MKKLLMIGLAAGLLLSGCAKGTVSQDGGRAQAHSSHNEMNMDHGGATGTAEKAPAQAQVQWKLSAEKPEPQQKTTVTLQINDVHGKPVEQFDTNHEKKMHLIVVSKDLSYFDHIHPVYKGKGHFEVTTSFPAGGDYKLIADFIPTGMNAMTQTQWVHVQGSPPLSSDMKPDTALTQVTDGISVTLATDPLSTGKETKLNFRLEEAGTKKPVTNLQPYLGAVGHVVILSADTEQYLHVHPMDEKSSGPDAQFMTTFPKAGLYKIWGQFQRDGKVFIASYVVQVS